MPCVVKLTLSYWCGISHGPYK